MEPLNQLPISLPGRGSRSILASLHHQLRAAILDGRLKPGVRLPSTRALAQLHGVSRNTAVAAYDRLLSEGYVAARGGSGTVVSSSLPRRPEIRGPESLSIFQRRLNPYWVGRSVPGRANVRAAPNITFQLGVPDAASFPYETWRRLAGRVLRRFRTTPTLLGDPQGLASFREAIATYVSFTRAVACGPEDIVVTAGAQQAFDLLARVLTTTDRSTVAIEDPGYPPLRAALQAHGARVRPVPVDGNGLIVDRIPSSARVICVTPSHQFPLGVVMSAQRRAQLLEHCHRRGAVVIEDDYDGEFRFEDRPLDALQTLDRAQSVFYVGTFSKTLLPDLRLGYIVTPPWAKEALVAAKYVSDGQCSTLLQATVSLLITEGHLARHVRRMQRIYARRRNILLQGLRSRFDRWLEPIPSMAGLHVAARLTANCDEEALILSASKHGTDVRPLKPFFAGPATTRGLLLGYGSIDEQTVAEGLARLRRAMPRR